MKGSVSKSINIRQNIKKEWEKHRTSLAHIQLALDTLLEEKRHNFPRFYFLSNE